MKRNQLYLILISLAVVFSCRQATTKIFLPHNEAFRYSGRIDLKNRQEPVLIGSAAFVEIAFSGDSCQILLKKLNPAGEHNYVSIELDGQYLGRVKLENENMQAFPVDIPSEKETHLLRIFKSTEAQNGDVAFGGIKAKALEKLPPLPERKIEFIGNSITCGMGVVWKDVPCDSGVWYDQHDAYLAYGPRVARALSSQFMLSSVSGIGVYRNWNSPGPVMPEVYENMHLNAEGDQWDFSTFTPDLVSIALGTNDFSDGDGTSERLPFDSAQYVGAYISFVDKIYSKYPATQICLLTSPMVSGDKGSLFWNCLQAVKQHFDENGNGEKQIAIFNFPPIEPHGCGYHPDSDDQERMAAALIPFYRKVMNW